MQDNINEALDNLTLMQLLDILEQSFAKATEEG